MTPIVGGHCLQDSPTRSWPGLKDPQQVRSFDGVIVSSTSIIEFQFIIFSLNKLSITKTIYKTLFTNQTKCVCDLQIEKTLFFSLARN